jgi:hypothetical protein
MSLIGYNIRVQGATYSGNTDFYYPGNIHNIDPIPDDSIGIQWHGTLN